MAGLRKRSLYAGLFEKNPVLMSGLIAAPVIVCTDTLQNALFLCYAFSAITFLSVLLSALVPRRFPYGLRIIAYLLIATLVYVPVSYGADFLFSGFQAGIGVYFPLLCVNSLITTQTEFLFDRRDRLTLPVAVLCYVLGFDLAVLLLSVVREFFAYGTIAGSMTGLTRLTPGLATPAGGFLLLALFAVLARKVRIQIRQRRKTA